MTPRTLDGQGDWLSYHGTMVGNVVMLEVKCNKLTDDGRCSIWETRPDVCRIFEEDGPDCRVVATARRPKLVQLEV